MRVKKIGTAYKRPEELTESEKGKGYGNEEYTRPDQLPDPYCGKRNEGGCRELLTTGFQRPYTEPKEIRNNSRMMIRDRTVGLFSGSSPCQARSKPATP